ncbi:MAG: hypothetical protein MPK75_00070 [Alphaproteobacteria bacterium]|nr:hypothetical protein [Alphaproteobacteria bacterium]
MGMEALADLYDSFREVKRDYMLRYRRLSCRRHFEYCENLSRACVACGGSRGRKPYDGSKFGKRGDMCDACGLSVMMPGRSGLDALRSRLGRLPGYLRGFAVRNYVWNMARNDMLHMTMVSYGYSCPGCQGEKAMAAYEAGGLDNVEFPRPLEGDAAVRDGMIVSVDFGADPSSMSCDVSKCGCGN